MQIKESTVETVMKSKEKICQDTRRYYCILGHVEMKPARVGSLFPRFRSGLCGRGGRNKPDEKIKTIGLNSTL
jgi:hypothetical protein